MLKENVKIRNNRNSWVREMLKVQVPLTTIQFEFCLFPWSDITSLILLPWNYQGYSEDIQDIKFFDSLHLGY